jgi:hypothetical protein
VKLDRLDAEAQPGGDALVRHAESDEHENLSLAGRQRRHACFNLVTRFLLSARLSLSIQRLADRLEQISIVERLRQKMHRAGSHRLNRHRYIAVTSNEDDRRAPAARDQFSLDIQPASIRKLDVQDEAGRRSGILVVQEIPRRPECLEVEAGNAEKTAESLDDRGIIIEQVHYRRGPHLVPEIEGSRK